MCTGSPAPQAGVLQPRSLFHRRRYIEDRQSEPFHWTSIGSEWGLSNLRRNSCGGHPKSPFVFPSPHLPDQPISTVKTAWKATLRTAGVPHFPIYNLRHVFCTRLSGVAADAVVQRAMRHTSPETKRRYQLGMTDRVRQAMEKSNKKAYGRKKVLRFYDVRPDVKRKERRRSVTN